MEKTKILAITTAIAALVVVALVGAVYAQTINPQNPSYPSGYNQLQQAQSSTNVGAYECGSYSCPRTGGANTYCSPQSAYSYGMGMRGGMMGGYIR